MLYRQLEGKLKRVEAKFDEATSNCNQDGSLSNVRDRERYLQQEVSRLQNEITDLNQVSNSSKCFQLPVSNI